MSSDRLFGRTYAARGPLRRNGQPARGMPPIEPLTYHSLKARNKAAVTRRRDGYPVGWAALAGWGGDDRCATRPARANPSYTLGATVVASRQACLGPGPSPGCRRRSKQTRTHPPPSPCRCGGQHPASRRRSRPVAQTRQQRPRPTVGGVMISSRIAAAWPTRRPNARIGHAPPDSAPTVRSAR